MQMRVKICRPPAFRSDSTCRSRTSEDDPTNTHVKLPEEGSPVHELGLECASAVHEFSEGHETISARPGRRAS
jgi:hypothetical protein